MRAIGKIAVCSTLALGILVTTLPMLRADATTAPAGGAMTSGQPWRKHHPARAHDNARIRNQRRLLRQDLKSGKITKDQFNAQMKDLNTIKREERVDARSNENGGHLNANQQQAINQQLNESRKDIHQDVKNDKVNP